MNTTMFSPLDQKKVLMKSKNARQKQLKQKLFKQKCPHKHQTRDR